MNETTSTNFLPSGAPPRADDLFRGHTPDGAEGQRVTLAWTDPEDGGTLWIELWGSPALVAELVDQGFALCDEPSADEFQSLPFLLAPAPSAGAHLRARILHPRTPGAG